VTARLAEQAAQRADAVAVESGEARLTYGALAAAADRLARHLRELGVGPEQVVGICLERSLDLVVGLLAIWQAGGAYLPLDPTYPAERLAFMVADSGARVLLTVDALADRLPDSAVRVRLDRERERIEAASARLSGGPKSEQSAYVIYTSGSTGIPKGVVVEHAALASFVAGAMADCGLVADDRVLQFASVSFDASADELYPCLASGATLVLRDEEMIGTFAGFSRAAERLGITVWSLPTAYWHGLAAEVTGGLPLPASVRLLLFGGEEAQAAPVAAWRRQVGGSLRLLNSYGPTEATVVTTRCDLTPGAADVAAGDTEVPIGRAVAGARTHVLGPDLEPVPAGEDGELWIGGLGLARGYLGRPELTALRFGPDPLEGAGGRLYRTGDLVRLRADGNLVFRGRVDDQVKVRGYRVELGEVEAALRRLPGVQAAAVVVQEDGSGAKRLAAFVVAAPGALETAEIPEAWRAGLAVGLPEHMIPATFTLLPSLPLTPSDKIDRAALARMETAPARRAAGRAADIRPQNPLQAVIAGIWSELLQVEPIGADDDFFALGGHSLLVAQALARLRQALGVEVPLAEIFRRPTPATLALWIERHGGERGAELPPLRPLPREERLGRPQPLSFAQERVWFLDQLAPGGRGGNLAYNFQVALRLWGPLDVAVLGRTLAEIVRRHEVLRTRFPAIDGRPVQVIEAAPGDLGGRLPVIDLSGLDAGLRERCAEALIDEQVQIPFDLARGALMRWRLLRHGTAFHTLVQVEHHFVHDGWSLAVLLREIEALYAAFARGEPSPLPELPAQYADYAVWQRQWMEGEVMERLLAFWRGKLAGAPPALEIATDRPRPPEGSFRGDLALLPVAPELYAALRRFGRLAGFTLYMTMLAGFLALLHRYTGEEDLVIGTGNANRRARELEGMIGMVVNTLVLRADLAGRPSFRALLARVRELALDTHAHQDMPFERLVQELRLERRPGRNPLFQLMFNFLDTPIPDFRFAGLEMFPDLRHNRTAKMDMNLVVAPRAEQRVGRGAAAEDRRATLDWEYNTDLFDRTTVVRMAAHYQVLLAGALADPDLTLPELPLLTPAEHAAVVAGWNDTAVDYPREATVPGLLAAQAARTPDAIAVTCGEQATTYAGLVAQGHRLAHHLRGLGAGPGELVALAVERSPDLVPAIVGILASGAAYLPLDPAYPAERLAFMLADSGARLLVCQEHLLPRLPVPDGTMTVVALGRAEERARIAVQPTAPPLPSPGSGDLAYVMYTSGSTGKPKGVAVTHRSVVRLVCGSRFARLGPEQVFLQLAPISFDASTFELWGPLLNGGRLAIFPPESPSLERLGEELARQGVTALWLTTGLFHQMVEGGNLEALRPLSQLMLGGEVISPALVRRALAELPGVALVAFYGPTEGTTFSTSHALSGPETLGATVPIGRPIANARGHVVDALLRPLPAGVPGELLIGGDGLALGYLGRPDLTALRFVPDPFAADERLYRTGDLVRWLADGSLEFFGRLDQQVKIRGFRVEPGEIEAALAAHPAVGAAAVLAEVGPGGTERRLVACVAPRSAADLGDLRPLFDELRRHLAAMLPAYMIPAGWMGLPSLPLTANGKVDRRALARLTTDSGAGGGIAGVVPEFVAPRTPEETAIAAIWREVLGVERVGVDDDFFLLGGHSLSATRVLSRLRRELGVELALAALFQHTTVAELAAVVGKTAPLRAPEERIAPAPDLVARDLTEDQLDALLGEMLEEEENG